MIFCSSVLRWEKISSRHTPKKSISELRNFFTEWKGILQNLVGAQYFCFRNIGRLTFGTSKFPLSLYYVTLNLFDQYFLSFLFKNTDQAENWHAYSQIVYLETIFSDFWYLMSIRQKTPKRKMVIFFANIDTFNTVSVAIISSTWPL